MEILARDGELDALKGACPVREGLHRNRLFCANKYGAMILLHRAHSNIADTDLRDRVERQLDWEPEITSTDIGVATDNGVVTLTGFVDSYAEKLAAERVTLKTYGVSAVANEIQVKLLFKKTDTDIASAALDALQARVDV
ncbi:MAG TPA: BON domain-containing protein, partial [Pyrinomonadaceae bacterium]|nr:BON domain-containing protein [Pyrinomonadaceae bacterium]